MQCCYEKRWGLSQPKFVIKRVNHETSAHRFLVDPGQTERELFSQIIRILAKQLGAPIFEPHLTLCATGVDSRRATRILKKINAVALRLSIRDVQCSAEFTKTLFVRFRSNAGLRQLIGEMQGRAGGRPSKIDEPHISLCYKALPAGVRKDLVAMIQLPSRPILFDSMKAVRCSSPTRTSADVKAWRSIARKKLMGSAPERNRVRQ